MKIFLLVIYRYELVVDVGDTWSPRYQCHQHDLRHQHLDAIVVAEMVCLLTVGRPGANWHLSKSLSCLYLWALHLRVWILVFGLERLGAFALSFSDIDNSARDLRTDRQIYHKKIRDQNDS